MCAQSRNLLRDQHARSPGVCLPTRMSPAFLRNLGTRACLLACPGHTRRADGERFHPPLCMVLCSAVSEVVGWLRLRTVKLSRSWIVFQNKIGLGWREKANIV